MQLRRKSMLEDISQSAGVLFTSLIGIGRGGGGETDQNMDNIREKG